MTKELLARLTPAVVTLTLYGAEDPTAPTPEKSGYSLFNPTPKALMREMSTDRPDKTESPYTVDAGHVQLETDLVTYTHDRDRRGGANTQVDAWSLAPINLKIGLCNRVDLQLVLETWNRVRTADRIKHTVLHQTGFGDLTTRLKVNCWGNDGGSTALALMPFIKAPTNQDHLGNHALEGGLIVPLGVELPGGWGLGMMTVYEHVQNEDSHRYHSAFVNSVTLSHDIIGNLGGYCEFYSEVSTEKGSRWIGTLDLGLTYGFTPNFTIDAGINLGVTPSADDYNPFVGLSLRF